MKFMAHVYYGDPLVSSGKLVKALKGIDILELGIPFSDPIADGRVFQLACQRALDKGVTPDDVFSFLASLKIDIPVVITTYYNIIYQKGISVFVDLLAKNKVYGLIVPDLPLEESSELMEACKKKRINLIYIIAPTTTDAKIKEIVSVASGFIYLVSVAGVTGTSKKAKENIKKTIKKIRKISDIPLYVGFGISKPEDIIKEADGFIVGSEICRMYQKDSSEKGLKKISGFVERMKKVCKQ